MLEIKNLMKTYTGKGGVSVKALDDVSVLFPERGMVFLLGKSGSGKSTLLNITGGLDKPDGGEIIVKGKSSKDFSGSDFDSYRNTFIGFVFQEYNILNDFTIEQNIALALQLQSKPNDPAAVAHILEQVDLAGYGKRKPNTLSGGQKQRVAIARALIKEPEIIMADEPTGALDSNTGKQVLDTLKKLSETKLVIVVSHDREFAEHYGDRIIELKDGRIISDVSKCAETTREETENLSVISEDTISVKKGEALTDAEVARIAELLRQNGGEAIITANKRELPEVRRACKLNEDGSKDTFKNTEWVKVRRYDGSKTKFIKSRLPLGHAVKMGASGLKNKPLRLIFTILLAVAAFVLFGVASTFMLYDSDYSVSEALKTANYPSIRVNKSYIGTRTRYEVDYETGEKTLDDEDTITRDALFGVGEVATRSKGGLSFAGIYYLSSSNSSYDGNYSLSLIKEDSSVSVNVVRNLATYYTVNQASGFCDCGEDYLRKCGFTILSGRYPAADDEVMLPEYLAQLFVNTEDMEIKQPADLVGRKISLSGQAINSKDRFTVVGIVKTGEIASEYIELRDQLRDKPQSFTSEESREAEDRLQDYFGRGYFSLIYVHESFYERYKDGIRRDSWISLTPEYYDGIRLERYEINDDVNNYSYASFFTESTMEQYKSFLRYYDLTGKEIAPPTLRDDEVYLSQSAYDEMVRDFVRAYASRLQYYSGYDPEAVKELGRSYDSDTEFNRLSDDYWNSHSLKGLKTYITKWYPDLAYKHWLYSAAQYMVMQTEEYDDDGIRMTAYDGETAFMTALGRVRGYLDDHEKESSDANAATKADWAEIECIVNRDFRSKYESYYYGKILESFYNVEQVLGEGMYGYASTLLWTKDISAEDFAEMKAKIDAALARIGMSADQIKSVLIYDETQATAGGIYYQGLGSPSKGNLKIVGYFNYGSDSSSSQYLVSASFLAAHAQKTATGPAYPEEYKTGYVAPADAKYNALISLTDNSFEQIGVALSAGEYEEYAIDNRICWGLMEFLEMIRDLEPIFLYVGLGLGLIAAFFLLNFISISISAKRKDIGILRAVGARGSDVFKIFYAEALLIALICFFLASIASFFVCLILNNSMAEMSISVKLLHFGIANVSLILGISIFVSVIATFFPVYFAARKSPVESIRTM